VWRLPGACLAPAWRCTPSPRRGKKEKNKKKKKKKKKKNKKKQKKKKKKSKETSSRFTQVQILPAQQVSDCADSRVLGRP